MIRTRHQLRAAGLGALLAALALAAPAAAAGPKEAQARKALKQALEDDYLQTRFDDAENRLRAAIQSCGTAACPASLRAELHAALGSILAVGKKALEDAREEFVEALQLDPKVQPHPDVLTAEVTFAFEQAKKQLKQPAGATPPAPPPTPPPPPPAPEPPKDEKPEPKKKPGPKKSDVSWGEPKGPDDKPKVDAPKDDKADDKPKEEPDAPKPSRKNWITLTFGPDLSIVSGTNVCTPESQSNHYICFRDDNKKTRYDGKPTKDNGDNINAGIGLSTLRLMLGYDRVIIENLTIGARIGFAFNGASGEGASFLPVHAEGRFGFWPGKVPFAGSGVRPYLMLSGGLSQIDTKVKVQVLEDGVACGAKNPNSTSSPCTVVTSAGNISMPEPRVQTLTVYRQAGLGFGSLSFGVHFAPTAAVALFLAVRGSITFPVVTGVISPEGGLSLGF